MRRKLISIICTLAMLMTVIAPFCVVSAEGTAGMQLVLDEAKSTETTKVIDVNYVGMTSVKTVQFKLPVDVDKISNISVEWDESFASAVKVNNIGEGGVGTGLPTGEYSNAISVSAFTIVGEMTAPNGNFVTLTIDLKEALTEDMNLQLEGLVMQGDGATAPATGLEAGGLVIAAPVATEAPATPVPTTAPIVSELGMNLTLDEAASTDTTKVIKVSYAGMTSVKTVQFKLPVDVEKISNIAIAWDESFASAVKVNNIGEGGTGTGLPTGEYSDAISVSAFTIVGEMTAPNGEFLTITIDLKEALTEEMVLQLEGLVMQGDGASSPATGLTGGNLAIQPPVVATPVPTETPEPTVEPTADPTATATPEPADARPTAMPTAEPEATVAPTEEPVPTTEPIVSELGMNLTLDEAASTDTTKVIKVSYAGMTSVKTVQFKLPVDVEKISNIAIAWDGSFESAVKVNNIGEGGTGTGLPTGEYSDAISVSAFTIVGEMTAPNGEFLTITIDLKEALTEEMVLQLEGLVMQGDGASSPATGLTGGNLVLVPTPEAPAETPVPTETPEPTAEPEAVNEIALKDLVDPALATDGAYVTIDTDGVYGTDYVAKDSDGNVLTETEFFNKVWGYDGAVADVINDLTLVIYTDGTEITANLNVDGNKVDSGSTAEGDEPGDDDNKDDEASVEWSVSPVELKLNKSKTVKLELNNIDIDDVDEIEYEITSGKNIIEIEVDEDNITKVTVSAGKKTGTAKVKATVTVGDETYTDTLTVKVKSSSSSSSGGSSSGGSNSVNVIAPGSTGAIVKPDATIAVNFTDLGEAAWASDAINYLASRGIVNGRSATTFAPNAEITRAEFAKLVMTVYGISPAAGTFDTNTYPDVTADAWYYSYIEAASYLGIVTGYPDGLFRPNDLVSRQEMALMMYRAANFMRTELPEIKAATAWSDADQIGDWSIEAVTALNVAGIMNGTSATTFEPTAAATRAQAAQMIYNLYQVVQ